ncbi:MAG: glycosyltransferase family 4 protein [Bacteroidota bacterium]|nr:glycosyltransferase family 4 protein [Bacteroidota bacterium]
MRSLNIVILAAVDLPEGGGETTRLKTLVNAIKEAGHTVTILLENTSGNVDEKHLSPKGEFNGIPYEYILGDTKPLTGIKFFTSKWKAVSLLKKRLSEMHRKQRVDVVWLNMLAGHTIYPVTGWAKRRGVKIIHSYEDERLKGTGLKRRLIYANQRFADKYLTRVADGVVVISHYLRDKYTALISGKVPVVIIPTVVNAEQWLAAGEPDNKPPVLLYYGSFFGFDEIEKMIDAVKLLNGRGRDVRLHLVGYNRRKPEYMEDIARHVKEAGVSHLVDLKGFTPHDKLKAYIDEANVLIGLRKDDEWSRTGLSTKLSEYLSTGRLVIATAIGDNTHYLEDGKNALLLAPGCSVEELAGVIEKAAEDAGLRSRIGMEGRITALQNFDTGVIIQRINSLLEKITEKK